MREQYLSEGVIAVGFGLYKGSVIENREWGDSMRKIKVPEAFEGSWKYYSRLASKRQNRLPIMNKINEEKYVSSYIGHRALGVVYIPEHEKFGNYRPTILPKRYNALIFLDETSALHPINIQLDGNQIPETYPFGM